MSANSSSDVHTEIRSVFESSSNPSEPLSTREVTETLRFSTERVSQGLQSLVEQGHLNTKTIGDSRVWWQSKPSSKENIPSQTRDDKDRRRLDLFENIQDIANVGAWEYDIANDESWVTDEVRRIHGFPLDADVPPEKSLECYHPDDRPKIQEAFERAVTEQEPYDLELRLIDTGGELHWVRTRGQAQVEDGEAVRVHGTLQDITERKRREQELERHRGLVEKTQSLARVGGYEIDTESGAFTWRSGISRLLETTAEEIVTDLSDAFEYVHPDDRDHVQTVVEQTIAEDSQFAEEFRIVTEDDQDKWIRMVAETETRDGTTLLQGTFQEITERKHRERKLERLNRAIEEAPVGVVMTDSTEKDNPLIYVNESFQEITGYSEEEILGRNCRFLQGEETNEKPVRQLREAIDRHESVAVELRNYRKDGEEFWNRVSIAPVENEEGDILNHVGFQRDITERKHREATLRQREQTLRELHAATQDLLGAHDEAEVADSLVGCLMDVFNLAFTGVLWFDEDDGVLRTATMSSSVAEVFDEPPTVEPGDNPVWDVYCDGETKTLGSNEAWDGSERLDDSMSEWVVVPIGDFGLLLAATADPDGISDDVVDPLKLLAANSNAVLERIDRRRKSTTLSQELQAHRTRVGELEELMDSIRAIQQRVADSDTREATETAVCEELLATDHVDFAWIGHPQTADTDLSPEAWAGQGRGYLDTVEHSDATQLPARRAAEQRQIQSIPSISQHVREGDWAKAALACEFNSVISLPIVYDGVLYGVLTAYSSQEEAFEQIYESLFKEVASFLGAHISMLSQRPTETDRTVIEFEFELTDAEYPLHRLAVETGCTLRFDAVIETTDETVRLLVTVQEGEGERVLAAADSMIHITAAEWFGAEVSGQLSLTVERPFLASRVEKHGGRLVDSVSDGETTRVNLHLPTNVSHRPLIEALSKQYRDIDLRSRTSTVPDRRTPDSLDELLTDRQREILTAAYYGGYYETPRGVTGEDLAENFDISSPVVYDHLQSAHHALLDRLFDEEIR